MRCALSEWRPSPPSARTELHADCGAVSAGVQTPSQPTTRRRQAVKQDDDDAVIITGRNQTVAGASDPVQREGGGQ